MPRVLRLFAVAALAVAASAGTPPAIASFTAAPPQIAAGQPATLRWAVTGATSLKIMPGVGAVTGTSVTVSPKITTTYTLTAGNAQGYKTAIAKVIVGTPPNITSFTAVPARVIAGQATTLLWKVSGAASLSIDAGVGAVTGTSLRVAPQATTTYTLTATNAYGSKTAALTVAAGTLPAIAGFTAAPAQISSGQSSTLAWTVTGAASVRITPGPGAVTGASITVSPRATTTYTLVATNAYGSKTATVKVTVGNPPAITSFKAAPAQIPGGQSSTLSWSVTGATSLQIDQGVGTVTGTSIRVTPQATTTYALTAANAFGTRTATVTVTLGHPPAIGGFSASPAAVAPGQLSTLAWTVTGATLVKVTPGVGIVTGTSVRVKVSATTTYTLAASNGFGASTAVLTIAAGYAPVISSFKASPAAIAAGQSSTLSWAVSGSPHLTISPAPGAVTGTSIPVVPSGTTTYTLAASNTFGAATATVTVEVGTPPAINSFWTNPLNAAGPGVPATLLWSTSGAASLSIDHGVGRVTGTSVNVSPPATTTYTLTAANAVGTVTATTTAAYIPLVRVNNGLFYSEHSVFLIPGSSQVAWTGSASWNSVFAKANVDDYVATLKSVFPGDYFFVVVAANNLTPNSVPSVMTYRHLADGIGMASVTGVGVPNICRYNIGGGQVIDGAFGVLDHEIGHNWGVFIGLEVGNVHWLPNSTADGQMAELYSDDGYLTIKRISGDPLGGFTWAAVDNVIRNENETFSLHDLYLQGLNDTFPDLYLLDSPIYNPDNTVSYSSVTKYDQAWVEQKDGLRFPTFRTSEKRFRVGFVYVARNMTEVLAVYQPIERSISHFVNGEQIDTHTYRFQVPFLVETLYRASVDALLTDLDGNRTPTLAIDGATDLVSGDGSAVVPFTAADPDGPAPVVSCVPASANCSIAGNSVVLQGLPPGNHFFTIKAQDAAGKKAFAHFVVEVP